MLYLQAIWRDGEVVNTAVCKTAIRRFESDSRLFVIICMKNPEYEHSESEEKDEIGFSEKDLDLDIEIRAGEWQNLRKFHTYKQRSRQGKIIATYQAVSNRLNQLAGMYYKLVRDNPTKAAKMLEELRHLRYIHS